MLPINAKTINTPISFKRSLKYLLATTTVLVTTHLATQDVQALSISHVSSSNTTASTQSELTEFAKEQGYESYSLYLQAEEEKVEAEQAAKEAAEQARLEAERIAAEQAALLQAKLAFVTSFANEVTGQYIDTDGAFGAQCWDLASLYSARLGAGYLVGGSGCAGYIGTDFAAKFQAAGLTVIQNPLISDLEVGDMICVTPYRANTGYYGHVAIVIAVNSDGTVTTLEQNAEQGMITAQYTRSYSDGDILSAIRK